MKIFRKTIFVSTIVIVFETLASSSYAQSYLSPGYIMGELRDALGVNSAPVAPDFVVRGRPDPSTLEYKQLKPPPRGFHSDESSPAGRLAAEAPAVAELEASRLNNQQRAQQANKPNNKQKTPAVSPDLEASPPPMNWKPWDTE